MENFSGILKEFGDSTSGGGKTIYSYITIDGFTSPKIAIFSGLDGKLRNSLGKKVTIHFFKNTIIALTVEDGQTFYTPSSNFGTIVWLSVVLVLCIPLCFVLIGVPVVLFAAWNIFKLVEFDRASKKASQLPNAIPIASVS